MVQSLGVLVGVDESAQSLRAVDWATQQAMVHGRILTVCHVLPYDRPDPPLADSVRAGLADRARSLVDRAVRRARHADRHLAVEGRLERGHVAEVLLGLAAGADEIVVGSRGAGAGGFALLRIGSVAARLAAHALCPVTVVGGCSADRSEVVIGMDGSGSGRAALDYGFRFASDHRLSVHAVHAYRPPMPTPNLPFPGPPYRTEEPPPERVAARELVRDAVAMWTSKYPDVPVRTTIAAGHPAATLVEASLGSTLLVVGSRGHGGFAGLLLGSVSQAVLHHAACPVAVVPHTTRSG
jgi:nucleotide-binding universal stress UspA family protein